MERLESRLRDVERRLSALEGGRPLSACGISKVSGVVARGAHTGKLYDLEVHAKQLPSVATHFEQMDAIAAMKAGLADLERLNDQVARLRKTVTSLEGTAGSVHQLSGNVE